MSTNLWDQCVPTLEWCEPVPIEEGEEIAQELVRLVRPQKDCAGLAAPQVGIDKQVFVMRVGDDIKSFINPSVTIVDDEIFEHDERCFSCGETNSYKVKRYKRVKVYHEGGTDMFENYEAAVAQHEMDHLRATMISDIGDLLVARTIRRETPKVGRNDPCPCQSKKKFKKCCGSTRK